MSDVLTICAWCPPERFTLLRAAEVAGQMLIFHFNDDGSVREATAYGHFPDGPRYRELQITAGICAACKAEHFPETVINPPLNGATQPEAKR